MSNVHRLFLFINFVLFNHCSGIVAFINKQSLVYEYKR